MTDSLKRAIDRRIDSKNEAVREGKVISVGPAQVLVQLVGSPTPIPCSYDPQQGVTVGKRVTLQWMRNARKYVITGVFGGTNGSTVISDQLATALELSPPANFAADDSLPSCIVVTWDVPPQQNVTYQIQQNSSASDVGAIDAVGGFTRGSMLIIRSDDPLYFRIRAVSPDFHYSSWSSWVTSGPGDPIAADHATGWLAQERVVTTSRLTPANTFTLIIGELEITGDGDVEIETGGDVYVTAEEDIFNG